MCLPASQTDRKYFEARKYPLHCFQQHGTVNYLACYMCCAQRSSAAQPSLLQKLPGGVAVAAPKQSVAAGQAAVFAGLGGWALVQAVLETPDAQAADTAGLQVAAAVAFAVYGFREYKKLSLGRSIGLSVGALTAGILLGAALNAWLRVDIVPLGSFSSPGVFVSTFGITALALASAFLA
eukprot:GHRQ01017922.1.p1 GENE.GHRQ01017922.1~~GHRQ01017922.1.p1  ORF type:complete len:180 (+),score=53.11 GHRQ01017922.1:871-1410(+)